VGETHSDSSNATLIRQVYAAMTARDFERAIEMVHPDLEAHVMFGHVTGAVYRGRAGARSYFEETAEVWGEMAFEVLSVEEPRDDLAVAEVRARVTGKESGVGIDQVIGTIFEFRDGKFVRIESHSDFAEAMSSAR
jgi:ketosteroid isomerase-like protein